MMATQFRREAAGTWRKHWPKSKDSFPQRRGLPRVNLAEAAPRQTAGPVKKPLVKSLPDGYLQGRQFALA